jgi:hypothetical protein
MAQAVPAIIEADQSLIASLTPRPQLLSDRNWLCVDGPGLARVVLIDASCSGAAMCSTCLRDTTIAGPHAIRGSGPNYLRVLEAP